MRGIEKQIDEQRAKGVTDKEMSGLIRNREMARFLVDNKQVIDFAKPILKKVVKGVQGWF